MTDDELFGADAKPCTCHPDDNPPVPCAKQYALSECRSVADTAGAKPDNLQEIVRLCRLFMDDESGKYNAQSMMLRIFGLAIAAPPAPSVADAAGASEDARDAARWRHLRNCGVIVDFTHAGPWKFTDDVDAAVDKLMARSAAINAASASKTTERKKLCTGSHIMCEGREYCLGHPSCSELAAKEAEIAALRERIAGMEKDKEQK